MRQRLTACERCRAAGPAPSFGGLHTLASARCWVVGRSTVVARMGPAPTAGTASRLRLPDRTPVASAHGFLASCRTIAFVSAITTVQAGSGTREDGDWRA